MLVWRKLALALSILGAVAMLAAPVALASGPSAGDQQYVDPLGGSHSSSGSSHHTSSSSHTTSTPAATTPVATTPVATTPTATTPATVTPTTTTTSPTATTASSGTTAASSGSDPAKTLPFTGFNAWLAVAVGVGLLGLGATLRRVSRGR
jgi:cytoskeletal protein RodZ